MKRNEREWNTIEEVMTAYINGEITTKKFDELMAKLAWKQLTSTGKGV